VVNEKDARGMNPLIVIRSRLQKEVPNYTLLKEEEKLEEESRK